MKQKNSNFKLLTLSLILEILLILTFFSPIFAQEATQSAIPQDQIKEKIKERLEKVAEEDLDKLPEIIKEEKAKKIYAYVGNIKSIENHNLTLKTIFGDKVVAVESQATILKLLAKGGKEEIELEDFKVEEFVIAMGPIQEGEILEGKRIIITSQPTSALKRKILLGKVKEIDDKKITFTTNGEEKTITLSSGTELKISGMEKPALDDVQIGDLLYSVARLDEKENIKTITTVLIIPGEANPAAKENEIEATPSASPVEE